MHGGSRNHLSPFPANTGKPVSRNMQAPNRGHMGMLPGTNTEPAGVAQIWNTPHDDKSSNGPAPAAVTPEPERRAGEHESISSYPVNNNYMPEFHAPAGPASDDNIWKPLTPYSNYAANAALPPAANNDAKPDMSNTGSATTDNWDPNTYLYSYMKSNDATQAPVASYPRDNSNIWIPSAAFQDNEYNRAAPSFTAKNDSSNIWKADDTYADRQRTTAARQSYYSAGDTSRSSSSQSPGSKVRKFVWSESGRWR
jgi:hypothetical protein